jgi:predicted DNA binding CopG/RHH family protein
MNGVFKITDKNTIPDFDNEESARDFFDTHNTVGMLDETEPEQLLVDPALKDSLRRQREQRQMVTLRISTPHLEGIKRIARKKGVPYQTLIHIWLAEALEREYKNG